MTTKKRICIIGAGPSGLLAIHHLTQVGTTGQDIVCFEKQSTFGGQWNFTWRTGTDEFGEPCHNSMYKDLCCNLPKELIELPHYTFDEHFGHAVPSYLRREGIREYIEGFYEKCVLHKFIKFNTVVRFVKYNESSDTFSVTVCDLQKEETYQETFTHVIVANGIFSTPYQPEIPGIATFPGIIMHSHSVRSFDILKGKKVLSIGNGASSIDTVLMGLKYGAKEVTLSYPTKPLSFNWPEGVQERPQVDKVKFNKVYFKDGTTLEPDVIIMCTGYKCHFPFMDNNLRLRTKMKLYPDLLYKGMLFPGGGNNRLFYMGVALQLTMNCFNMQAMWIARYIHGCLKDEPATCDQMIDHMAMMARRLESLPPDHLENVSFKVQYVVSLCKDLDIDSGPSQELLGIYNYFVESLRGHPLTYRDASLRSVYTGTLAAAPEVPWFSNKNS